MSKNSKVRRKTKQQKQKRARRAAAGRSASQRRRKPWRMVVEEADRLIGRGQRWEAREVLEEYERTNPGQPVVLQRLLDVYYELSDFGPYCHTCRKLLTKTPNDPVLHLMLAAGYLANARPASALQAFRHFLRRWPDDPMAEGVRESASEIEPDVDELLEDFPFAEDEKVELAAMHEEVLDCLITAEYERVILLTERLLGRSPDFIPAMNNASQAYFMTGQPEEAVAVSQRALELDSDNFHALANLARYLFLSGRGEEADEMRQRLRLARSDQPDIWAKKAETLSFFGDDQGVLDALRDARRNGCTRHKTPDAAMLCHLAAVAYARQGQEAKARRLWRKSRRVCPGFDMPGGNLSDAKLPPGERHGPWPFQIDYWIPQKTLEEMIAAVEEPLSHEDEKGLGRAARRFAEAHPEVVALVPALLDRGDEAGRELAWRFAMLLGTDEMHQSLCDFCLSQRGPDAMRRETASYLSREGVLASGSFRMWQSGRWEEVMMFGFEITDEPTKLGRSPAVNEWAYDAMQALHDDDGQRAEVLLRKCLEVEGDVPDLLNNLAIAYQAQGRQEESLELLRQVHQRWPDYFFGCIAMARLAIRDGDHKRAEEYLAPLCRHRKLHHTEFTALCSTYIELYLGCREFDAAETWLNMWKDIQPDHPGIERYESRFMFGRMRRWFAGREK